MVTDPARVKRAGEKVVKLLSERLGSLDNLRILDVGFGVGGISTALSARNSDVVGVDITTEHLAYSRGERTFRVLLSVAESLPFPDSTFDVVVANHILEHVSDPQATVGEISRVLKPDGVAYLANDNKLTLIEPHYSLPLLSWLPSRLADAYVHITGRAEKYSIRIPTFWEFHAWLLESFEEAEDITLKVISDPSTYHIDGVLARLARHIPATVLSLLRPFLPGWIFLARK